MTQMMMTAITKLSNASISPTPLLMVRRPIARRDVFLRWRSRS
jgi:hypothetical protein